MSDVPMVGSMIVVRRIHEGVLAHLPIRISEWLMAYPAACMGLALMMQPTMFATSPSFGAIERLGDEAFWTTLVLLCAVVRLIALTVNGTFENFKYSPHLRLAASAVGIAFWSQFTLGFLMSALFEHGAWSAVVAYSTFCLAELANIYRSWVDVTKARK